MSYRKKKVEILKLISSGALVLLLLTGYKAIKPGESEGLIRRFEQIAVQTQSTIEGNDKIIEGSTHERLTHLLDAWEVIKLKWLWGTGLGYKNYLKTEHEFKIPRTPHNIVVNYFAQMGVIGFSFFCLINYFLFFSKQFSLNFPVKLFLFSVFIHLCFNDYYLQPIMWAYIAFLPIIWIQSFTVQHQSEQSL